MILCLKEMPKNDDAIIRWKITDKFENAKLGEIKVMHLKIDGKNHDEFEDGTYEATSEITIEGNTGSYTLPEKLFELTGGTIYSMSTENAKMVDFTDDGDDGDDSDTGLSGGIIAVIVIVCIIAVAAIAFCVYWFVFRNKETPAA